MARCDSSVLVSPLGLSPGALYSALMHLRPDRLVLITGADAIAAGEKVLAEYQHVATAQTHVEHLILDDPLSGFAEAHRKADPVAERLAAENVDVIVNLTGGTTALQYCVTCVGLALPGARFVAVVDERSRASQLGEPLVVGKMIDVPRPIFCQHTNVHR